MANKLKIAATVATGFWRCGKHWPAEGVVVDASDFKEGDLERLLNEPMLRVSEPTDAEVADASPPNELHARIADVVSTLAPDDFGQDGKPKVGALTDRLGDEFGKITASDRDAAWEDIQANGFEPPVTED